MREIIVAADAALLRGILDLPHPDWLTWVFRVASLVGSVGGVWVAWGLLLAAMKAIRWPDFARLVLAIALVHLVVDVVLKPWIDRPRPPLVMTDLDVVVDIPETRAFPSGHAAHAFAAGLVLTRAWRPRLKGIVWAAAGLVAVARVYLGIHYPFDALGGCLTGLGCGWLALRIPFTRPTHIVAN